ncbi:cardiolipin synthase [Henriciella aquimarina]|uniref:cardiolipin synthase n=1 Tax=Henriciella aquimarina TaxID=545261 RepID=UPI001301E73A|nr:cardiolipin synthase [Henriciella aquimarina]
MIGLGIGLQAALVVIGIFVARAAITTARTPQGAAAWVVFLVSFPLLALPAFALFGSVSRLSSGRAGQDVQPLARPEQGRLDSFANLAANYPTDGNTVTLLVDGQATFDAIFAAIDAAEREILVQFYIIRSDAIGDELKDHLIRAARRGVEVRVLCDIIGSLFLSFSYVRALQAEGIQIRRMRGPSRALGRLGVNFRNHRKAVVVDGSLGFTGGINVGQEYIDGGKRFESWRDTHLSIKGPMVTQLRDIFAFDWNAVTGKKLPSLQTTTPSDAPGSQRGLIMGFGPTDRLERGSLLLCGLVNLARHRLWIATPYLVPHADLVTALQLSSVRGVEVRILIPEPSDNNIAWYASRNAARSLSEAGVEVCTYQPGFMHSKVILIDDDIASVGTVNLDIRSALINFEETALIEDPTFAAEVETMLEEDFSRSRPVAIPGPWHVRLLAPVARLFGPLL